MAIFVPLSKESQEEAIKRMLPSNNIWDPRSGLSVVLEKDFPANMFFMTMKEPTGTTKVINDEIDLFSLLPQVTDLGQRVQYRGRVNSIGRRCFELIFEDKIKVDKPVVKKVLESTLENFAHTETGKWVVARILKIQQTSCIISSIMGGDISVESFKLPPDLSKRRDEVLAHLDKYDVSKELKDISEEFVKRQIASGQYAAVIKGSGDKKADFQQISVAKGYISDVNGNTDPDPIKSNFIDGFSSTDYFKSASGNRKGVVDRVMNTAKSGYLTRQLAYLLAPLKSGSSKFCGTKHLVEILLTDEMLEVLDGRVLENGDTLTKEYAEKHKLIDKTIKYYSPLYCHSPQLCHRCYPEKFRIMVNDVPNVGIIAGQAVGERCTQLIMRSFHCLIRSTMLTVKIDGIEKILTIENLWNSFTSPILSTENETEEERVTDNLEVYDNGKWSKVYKISRHRRLESSPMVKIRTNNKHYVICQDNHPLMATNDNGKTFEAIQVRDLYNKGSLLMTVDGLSKVRSIEVISFNDEEPVYDLNTESHTFTANGIWSHNSGGASKIVYLNSECPATEEYISQDGLNIYAKKSLSIKIENPDMDTANTYTTRDFYIIDNGEDIEVNFSAMIEFDGLSASKVTDQENGVVLEFEEGAMLGQINASAVDVTSATMILQSIMDHADNFETPEQMVMELYETFKLAAKVPLLYLEMIVSQMIRDPDKPVFPYRLGSMSKPPLFVGIKRVAATESGIRGIMFERMSDVIINNVINGNEDLNQKDAPKSDLEDLFRL